MSVFGNRRLTYCTGYLFQFNIISESYGRLKHYMTIYRIPESP